MTFNDSQGRYQGLRKTFSTSFQLVAPAAANAFFTIAPNVAPATAVTLSVTVIWTEDNS